MANTFNRKFSSNVGNTFVKVGNYTVAANTSAVVLGLNITNTSGGVVTANVSLNNGQSDFYLAKNTLLSHGSSLSVAGGDQKLVLQTGDSIKVSSSGITDAMSAYLEQDTTAGRGSEYEYYTFGPRVQVANAYAGYDTLYDSVSDRVVISSWLSNDRAAAIVGEVVDNTITFGPENQFGTVLIQSSSITMDTTNNKVVAWNGPGTIVVGVIHPGNNTVSFGSPVTFDTPSFPATIDGSGDITYDSINNRVVVAYEKGTFPQDTYVVVGEVSGFSVNFGTPVLVQEDTNTNYGPKIDYIPSAQRIAVTYSRQTSSNLNVRIGYVSGNTITFGDTVIIDANDTYFPTTTVTSTGELAIAYIDYGAAPYPTKVVAGTVSSNTVTFGSKISISDYEQNYINIEYWSGQNKLLVTSTDEATITRCNVAIIDISGTTLTLVEDKEFLDGEIDRASSGVSVGGENNFLLVYNDYINDGFGNISYTAKATLLSY